MCGVLAVAEESQAKSGRYFIRIRTTVHMPSLDVELSSVTRPSEVDASLQSLLDAVQSQANKIVGVAGLFGQVTSTPKTTMPAAPESDPYSRMAYDLGVNADELKSAKIVGFKEGKPQILSTSKFATPEKGCLALFYAFEIGLDKSPILFEEGEEAFNTSRYTEPFAGRVLNNLKNTNKINRSRYDNAHEIVLTPSGIEDAREVLKAALSGAIKPRKKRKKARSK